MGRALTIALDAMGGDQAPAVVLDGAGLARERYPDARFLIFGDEERLRRDLSRHPAVMSASEIVHTDEVVGNDMKPSQALRHGRSSSMGLAVDAVRSGDADVVVSAGNTGALMALAKFTLRTMEGIDRPALISLMPTLRGESAMLDLGANLECSERNLVQFAIMGAAYARILLGLSRPKVGLLNVGSEELKGHDELKMAAELLNSVTLPLEFVGFVEGDDVGKGTIDVYVSDGFTGNIALKMAEGTARMATGLMQRAFRNSPLSKLGYLLARGGLRSLRDHLDPNTHNGGVLLGLNGLVVKSHGGADARGYASAIGVAIDMAKGDLSSRIAEDLKNFESPEPPRKAAAS